MSVLFWWCRVSTEYYTCHLVLEKYNVRNESLVKARRGGVATYLQRKSLLNPLRGTHSHTPFTLLLLCVIRVIVYLFETASYFLVTEQNRPWATHVVLGDPWFVPCLCLLKYGIDKRHTNCCVPLCVRVFASGCCERAAVCSHASSPARDLADSLTVRMTSLSFLIGLPPPPKAYRLQ